MEYVGIINFLLLIIMDINNSVNPSTGVRVELNGEAERATFHREPPPPYSPHDNTVTNQPVFHQTVIIQPALKNVPMVYNCTNCGETIVTKVKYENTKKTHMLAGFVFGFTLWCTLCCLAAIPYMVKTFKKVHHYCPNCDTLLGKYSKL